MKQLDLILVADGNELLTHAGSISAQIAKEHAVYVMGCIFNEDDMNDKPHASEQSLELATKVDMI